MTMKRDAVNDLMEALVRVRMKLNVVDAIDCDRYDQKGQCKALHDPVIAANAALDTLQSAVNRMDFKTYPPNNKEG